MCAFHVWPKMPPGYKRIISRGCHGWSVLRTVVCQIQRRRPFSTGPPAHCTPSNPRSSIFEGCCRRLFERDKPRIGDRVWKLPANTNQRITWHRKGVQAREVESFKTEQKPQDPYNCYLSVNARYGQEGNFFDSILTGDEIWITHNSHRGLQWLKSDQVP